MSKPFVVLLLIFLAACSSTSRTRPANPENICDIFRQNQDWYKAAVDVQERWKVPLAVPMSMMYQESSFRYDARPPMGHFLFIPTGRASSVTSRSGGLSESMNQRAVSAPQVAMISSGSTTFFFDFDIFSIEPISTGSPVARSLAERPPSASVMLISAGDTHSPCAL